MNNQYLNKFDENHENDFKLNQAMKAYEKYRVEKPLNKLSEFYAKENVKQSKIIGDIQKSIEPFNPVLTPGDF